MRLDLIIIKMDINRKRFLVLSSNVSDSICVPDPSLSLAHVFQRATGLVNKTDPQTPIYPGDPEAVARPDPIPNSAVKRCVANGSACRACARVGRCRVFLSLFPLLFSPGIHTGKLSKYLLNNKIEARILSCLF